MDRRNMDASMNRGLIGLFDVERISLMRKFDDSSFFC